MKSEKSEVHVDHFNEVYYNIEGYVDTGNNKELILGSHYDTVFNSPGANDNLSAIAVMLEAARVIAEKKDTIDKIDFGFLKKVTQATVNTIYNVCKNQMG